MNGTRLSVCLLNADAQAATEAARLAERFDLDLWLGHPDGTGPYSDDSYVMTTAAGVVGVTTNIRIGIFLNLRGSAGPLRLAEDVGVVDQASQGRLELGLVAPRGATYEWEERARQLLAAWHEWPAGKGRTVAASPAPAQPWVSRLIVGVPDLATSIADRLRGGVVVQQGSPARAVEGQHAMRRTVVTMSLPAGFDGVRDWLAADPVRRVLDIRAEANDQRAHEVLVLLDGPTTRRPDLDLQALGTVVAPAIRCSAHQAALLAYDAWNWLTELSDLHDGPTRLETSTLSPAERA